MEGSIQGNNHHLITDSSIDGHFAFLKEWKFGISLKGTLIL